MKSIKLKKKSMCDVVISGTGIYIPPDVITTEELIACHNKFVENFNQTYQKEIAAGTTSKLAKSSVEFVIRASGIRQRHTIDKAGILNPDIMHPLLPPRSNSMPSVQSEMAVYAAKEALLQANKTPADVDAVIVACSNMQRPYPAIAIEAQALLGCNGFAYDLNAACSSAAFGINSAYSLLISNHAKCVLTINPEIYTAHVNFRDRRSHFIFGDGCSAAILEKSNTCIAKHAYKILSGKLQTKFSNNIRNNFGFLNRSEQSNFYAQDKLFMQNGKNVREEVVPLTSEHILKHLSELSINPQSIKRLWLHQANIHMNHAIAQNVLGRTASEEEVPTILADCGNTGASGVMIAFHKSHSNLRKGDIGVLCSFGAGYSVGSVVLEKTK